MKIGLDCDEVLCGFVDSYRAFLKDHYGVTRRLPDPVTYEMWEDWGVSKEQFIDDQSAFADVIYGNAAPMKGALSGVERLRQAGHQLYVITARPEAALEGTFDWLTYTFPGAFHGIVVDADKTVLRTDLYFDDRLDTVASMREAGLCAMVFDRPWNKSRDVPRVHNWDGLVRHVGFVDGDERFLERIVSK